MWRLYKLPLAKLESSLDETKRASHAQSSVLYTRVNELTNKTICAKKKDFSFILSFQGGTKICF